MVEHGCVLFVDLLLFFELVGCRGGDKCGELDLLCDAEVF